MTDEEIAEFHEAFRRKYDSDKMVAMEGGDMVFYSSAAIAHEIDSEILYNMFKFNKSYLQLTILKKTH